MDHYQVPHWNPELHLNTDCKDNLNVLFKILLRNGFSLFYGHPVSLHYSTLSLQLVADICDIQVTTQIILFSVSIISLKCGKFSKEACQKEWKGYLQYDNDVKYLHSSADLAMLVQHLWCNSSEVYGSGSIILHCNRSDYWAWNITHAVIRYVNVC